MHLHPSAPPAAPSPGPQPARRVARVARVGSGAAALLALGVLAAACGRTPPEPPAPAVIQIAGSYTGTITVDGSPLPARMTVGQEGAVLSLQFQVAEIGVATQGEGVAHADRFTGRVPYQIVCPGEAEFEGRLDDEGRVLSGTLRATDCEGTVNGTFRFTRPSP